MSAARAEKWYFRLDGKLHGPVSLEELQYLCSQGTVSGQTQVRASGTGWLAASQVQQLVPFLQRRDEKREHVRSVPKAPARRFSRSEERENFWLALGGAVLALLLLLLLCLFLWGRPGSGGQGGTNLAGKGQGEVFSLGPRPGPTAAPVPQPAQDLQVRSSNDQDHHAHVSPEEQENEASSSGDIQSESDPSAMIGPAEPSAEQAPAQSPPHAPQFTVGASFFGLEGKGNKFVYVIDCSSSMAGVRLQRAKEELLKSIYSLDDFQKFYVIFYNTDAYPMFWPDRLIHTLLPVTKKNLETVTQWVEAFWNPGGTDPWPAMQIALSLEPDTIFLLTDGEFDLQVADRIRQANRSETVIHTIGLGSAIGEAVLRRIAKENGGQFRAVSIP